MELGVNIDHIATIRNARGTLYPDLVNAAQIAIDAGADFITIHLREDRRHIKDKDLYDLKSGIQVRLNLEIAATKEMLDIAKEIKPYSICIVPEKREELTTEGGLCINSMRDKLLNIVEEMHNHNVKVSLFIDPDFEQLKYLKELELKPDIIELHTGNYCNNPSETNFKLIIDSAQCINALAIECHAGHGITYEHAKKVRQVPYISALNIGHYLISEAVLHGLYSAVKVMKTIITN
ncbi:pyridoxine 5'-phosphate synthase [Wolbachia pipientis]|uniref:Pyridoxine 5'-phosphate synthase n=1 Tax=Wolbachia pipientis TaxID=955 RepID=A0A1E7QJX2_WOLPI|nr:pyridoxine 5'-phosphate synthase [Wolbachia pipientis]OEY86656.1 pyridoxine 5'-phosphate synthase [Wolbachia pipientis]